MIIAVLIFRFCDAYRKRETNDLNVRAQRPFSQYFIFALYNVFLLFACAAGHTVWSAVALGHPVGDGAGLKKKENVVEFVGAS